MAEDTKQLYVYRYPHPAVTTDCVIFGYDVDTQKLQVLLIERGIEPYKGRWAFPGGFLKPDENAKAGALRELGEETHMIGNVTKENLHEFGCFTEPDRDPRERIITIAFYALIRKNPDVQGGDDAKRAEWYNLDDTPPLAFDHDHILARAREQLKRSIHFEPIGFDLLPEEFTMTDLQNLYEQILDFKFDRRNFAKKMKELGIVTQLQEKKKGKRRESYLYKFNKEQYAEMKKEENETEGDKKKTWRIEF